MKLVSLFLLLAGASAVASAFGGALAFVVDVPPSWKDWAIGSAFIYIILIAGAGANCTSTNDGAFTFDVGTLPLDTWWYLGSAFIYNAPCWCECCRLFCQRWCFDV